jgi:hypothetical protein
MPHVFKKIKLFALKANLHLQSWRKTLLPSIAQMIQQWAFSDAALELDSIDSNVIKKFVDERIKSYKNALTKISNLTIFS